MATKPWQEQQQWTKKQQQLCSLTDIILHKISLTRLLITQYLSNAEKYHQSDKKWGGRGEKEMYSRVSEVKYKSGGWTDNK